MIARFFQNVETPPIIELLTNVIIYNCYYCNGHVISQYMLYLPSRTNGELSGIDSVSESESVGKLSTIGLT